MKNKLLISLFVAIVCSNTAMGQRVYINAIINDTRQTMEFDKLPTPGLLGRIRPVAIAEETKKVLKMPVTTVAKTPFVITIKNQHAPKYMITLEISIIEKQLKRLPSIPVKEIKIVTKNRTGKILKTLTQQLHKTRAYYVNLTIQSRKLKKIDVNIMSAEIPKPKIPTAKIPLLLK